jgi:hypothetical protein
MLKENKLIIRFCGGRRLKHVGVHFPSSGAQVKNVWSCTSAYPHIFIA